MADDEATSPERRLAATAALLREVLEARRRLDRVEFYAVELARAAGATWEDVGELFGISRQAARQRFGEPRQRRRRPESRAQ